ncbi:hypothetical protein TRVL_09494 [Trypanosoma vivax]|nr:hypothetical protein TRVL_09494 [Trypanosoma vivax]
MKRATGAGGRREGEGRSWTEEDERAGCARVWGGRRRRQVHGHWASAKGTHRSGSRGDKEKKQRSAGVAQKGNVRHFLFMRGDAGATEEAGNGGVHAAGEGYGNRGKGQGDVRRRKRIIVRKKPELGRADNKWRPQRCK